MLLKVRAAPSLFAALGWEARLYMYRRFRRDLVLMGLLTCCFLMVCLMDHTKNSFTHTNLKATVLSNLAQVHVREVIVGIKRDVTLSLSLSSIQLLVVGSPCGLVACRGTDQKALRGNYHTNGNVFLKYMCMQSHSLGSVACC